MRDPTRLEQTSDGYIDRKVFKVVRANEGKLHKSLHNQAPLSVPNERVDEDQLELSEDEGLRVPELGPELDALVRQLGRVVGVRNAEVVEDGRVPQTGVGLLPP